jgi:hypothetical protein
MTASELAERWRKAIASPELRQLYRERVGLAGQAKEPYGVPVPKPRLFDWETINKPQKG